MINTLLPVLASATSDSGLLLVPGEGDVVVAVVGFALLFVVFGLRAGARQDGCAGCGGGGCGEGSCPSDSAATAREEVL